MKSMNAIIFDSLDEIIRYGEFDPSYRVLDEVLEFLMESEGADSVYYDAINGDLLLARLRIKHLVDKCVDAQIRADRREAQLLREYAEHILTGYEDRIWALWDEKAMPMQEEY